MTKFLSIEPKRFRYISSGVEDVGFIAEEVEEAGMPEFVCRDPVTGEITGLVYEHMVSPLLQIVKECNNNICELELLIQSQQELIDAIKIKL